MLLILVILNIKLIEIRNNHSNSFKINKNKRDVERVLTLTNRPNMPPYVKHKREKSENASEDSGRNAMSMYYYLYFLLDNPRKGNDTNFSQNNGSTMPMTRSKNFDRIGFVNNPSPSLKDCDVTRPIRKPISKQTCY